MSQFHPPPAQTAGPPTFTAVSASLNLSGLDHFAPLADSDIMEAEWYHSQDHYHHLDVHAPLSPGHEPFAAGVSAAFSYPSHTVSVTDDAFRSRSDTFLIPISFFTFFHILLFPIFPFFSSRRSHTQPCAAKSGVHRFACRHRTSLHAIARDLLSQCSPNSHSSASPHDE